MTAFAAMVCVLQAVVIRGTTPALIGTALMLFLLGLEAMEPLSQEIDQPDRTDSLPIERGELLVRHLIAPAIALVPFAVIAAACAVAVLGTHALVPAAILALPTVLAGAAGGVVSIVRDAPDPTKGAATQAFVPPEMAGISSAMRIGLPILVSVLAAATVLLARHAEQLGTSVTGGALRGAVGATLLAIMVTYWVRQRDHWRRKFRQFMSDGQAHTKQQRSTPA
jgi:predicted PurR-regulated permease PerM